VISEQGPRRRPRLSSLQQLGLPFAESVHETRPGMQLEGPSPCCMPALSSEACRVIGTRVLMTFVIMKSTQARIEPPAGCQAAPLRRRKRGRYAACYRIAVVSTAPLMPGTYSCLSGTRICSWQMRSQPEQTRRDVSTAVISACSALHDLAATEGMFDVWWLSVNIHPLQCHFLHCAFLPCPPALLSLSFWHDAGNGKFRGSTFESHTITKDLLHSTLMR